MSSQVPGEITVMLRAAARGDSVAFDRLMAKLYDELRRLAARHLRHERRAHTLQATAVVHEAYLKLLQGGALDWQDRAQFFGAAASAVRRILVDHARKRNRRKRGGGRERVALPDAESPAQGSAVDLVALDEALGRLRQLHDRQARIVELRYFAGLSSEECAEVLAVSVRTIFDDWKMARSWLQRELTRERKS